MEVIVLCGPMGAGKSTAARYIAERLNGQILSFTGGIFTPILKVLGLAPSREAFQGLGEVLMQWPGEAPLVEALLRQGTPGRRLIFDDVRYGRTLELVRRAADTAVVLYVDADPAVRLQRLQRRDGMSDRAEFMIASQRSTENQIESLAEEASAIVRNNGSLKEFYDQVARTLTG